MPVNILFFLLIQCSLLYGSDIYHSPQTSKETEEKALQAESGKNDGDTLHLVLQTSQNGKLLVTASLSAISVVHSLDFAIEINADKLSYDSLLVYAQYLDGAIASFNSGDSTVRFSSFSFQEYQNNTPLVALQFLKLQSIDASDFYNYRAYINGFPASVAFTSLITGVEEINNSFSFQLYPNPATEYLRVETDLKDFILEISDMRGIKHITHVSGKHSLNHIPVSTLKTGMYVVTLRSEEGASSSRMLIIH